MLSAQVQRDSARYFVEHKCSPQKSQKSLPAVTYPCSPWWGADGPIVPGKSLSSLTTLKAFLFYIRLLNSAIFSMIVNSDMILKVLLLFIRTHVAHLGLTALRFYVCLVVFLAFQQYRLPSFASLLSDVTSFSAGIRCLNCWGSTDYTYAYICKYGCVLCCYFQLKIVLKDVHRPDLSWTFSNLSSIPAVAKKKSALFLFHACVISAFFLNKFLDKMAVEFRLSLSLYKFMPFDTTHSLKHFSWWHFTILLCFLDFVLFFKMELILEYRTPVRLKAVHL